MNVKDKKSNLNLIVSIILCAVIAIFIFKYHRFLLNLNIKHLKRFILSYGKFSSVVFIVLYTLKPIVIFVPASLLSLLAGNVFGPWNALLLSMIGCFGSATVGFYMARILGKPFVERVTKGKTLKLGDELEKHGFKIMFLMRLAVVFPYDGLSYAAGLSRMKYKDFVIATLLGVLPEMISYSIMGENIRAIRSVKFYYPIILTGLVAIISYYIYKSYKKTK